MSFSVLMHLKSAAKVQLIHKLTTVAHECTNLAKGITKYFWVGCLSYVHKCFLKISLHSRVVCFSTFSGHSCWTVSQPALGRQQGDVETLCPNDHPSQEYNPLHKLSAKR